LDCPLCWILIISWDGKKDLKLLIARCSKPLLFILKAQKTMKKTIAVLGLLVIATSHGRAWIPGAFLIAFGLRLANGRPLLA